MALPLNTLSPPLGCSLPAAAQERPAPPRRGRDTAPAPPSRRHGAASPAGRRAAAASPAGRLAALLAAHDDIHLAGQALLRHWPPVDRSSRGLGGPSREWHVSMGNRPDHLAATASRRVRGGSVSRRVPAAVSVHICVCASLATGLLCMPTPWPAADPHPRAASRGEHLIGWRLGGRILGLPSSAVASGALRSMARNEL